MKLDKSTKIPSLSRDHYNAEEVAIPSVDIQREVVAELETQLTRLDASVIALKHVQANLKRYRASVLKAACEGRLVPTEAELANGEGLDYESGTELLAKIIQQRRSKWLGRGAYKEPIGVAASPSQTLPDGWVWATWDQIGISQNGRPFPSAEYRGEGVRLLRPGNLHASGSLVWTPENSRFMAPNWADEYPDLIVREQELVMNLTAQSLKDEFLGRVCLTSNGEHCLLNQRLARLSPIQVSTRFMLWIFKSPLFRRFVDGLNTGSLIQHMFTSKLAAFVLPLPPLVEQHRIVAEVERRLSVIEELEATVAANLKRAEGLRQSVLRVAFTMRS